MKQLKLIGVPTLLLSLLVVGLVLNGLRVKNEQAARYRLPEDTSPRSLLEFMRIMDGSPTPTAGILHQFVKKHNDQAKCNAIWEASQVLDYPSSELTIEENREALFYRIKYTSTAIEQGYRSGTPSEIKSLESHVRDFLADSVSIGRREVFAALYPLLLFETHGSQSLNLENRLTQLLP